MMDHLIDSIGQLTNLLRSPSATADQRHALLQQCTQALGQALTMTTEFSSSSSQQQQHHNNSAATQTDALFASLVSSLQLFPSDNHNTASNSSSTSSSSAALVMIDPALKRKVLHSVRILFESLRSEACGLWNFLDELDQHEQQQQQQQQPDQNSCANAAISSSQQSSRSSSIINTHNNAEVRIFAADVMTASLVKGTSAAWPDAHRVTASTLVQAAWMLCHTADCLVSRLVVDEDQEGDFGSAADKKRRGADIATTATKCQQLLQRVLFIASSASPDFVSARSGLSPVALERLFAISSEASCVMCDLLLHLSRRAKKESSAVPAPSAPLSQLNDHIIKTCEMLGRNCPGLAPSFVERVASAVVDHYFDELENDENSNNNNDVRRDHQHFITLCSTLVQCLGTFVVPTSSKLSVSSSSNQHSSSVILAAQLLLARGQTQRSVGKVDEALASATAAEIQIRQIQQQPPMSHHQSLIQQRSLKAGPATSTTQLLLRGVFLLRFKLYCDIILSATASSSSSRISADTVNDAFSALASLMMIEGGAGGEDDDDDEDENEKGAALAMAARCAARLCCIVFKDKEVADDDDDDDETNKTNKSSRDRDVVACDVLTRALSVLCTIASKLTASLKKRNHDSSSCSSFSCSSRSKHLLLVDYFIVVQLTRLFAMMLSSSTVTTRESRHNNIELLNVARKALEHLSSRGEVLERTIAEGTEPSHILGGGGVVNDDDVAIVVRDEVAQAQDSRGKDADNMADLLDDASQKFALIWATAQRALLSVTSSSSETTKDAPQQEQGHVNVDADAAPQHNNAASIKSTSSHAQRHRNESYSPTAEELGIVLQLLKVSCHFAAACGVEQRCIALRAFARAQLLLSSDLDATLALLQRAEKLQPNSPHTALLLFQVHLAQGVVNVADEQHQHEATVSLHHQQEQQLLSRDLTAISKGNRPGDVSEALMIAAHLAKEADMPGVCAAALKHLIVTTMQMGMMNNTNKRKSSNVDDESPAEDHVNASSETSCDSARRILGMLRAWVECVEATSSSSSSSQSSLLERVEDWVWCARVAKDLLTRSGDILDYDEVTSQTPIPTSAHPPQNDVTTQDDDAPTSSPVPAGAVVDVPPRPPPHHHWWAHKFVHVATTTTQKQKQQTDDTTASQLCLAAVSICEFAIANTTATNRSVIVMHKLLRWAAAVYLVRQRIDLSECSFSGMAGGVFGASTKYCDEVLSVILAIKKSLVAADIDDATEIDDGGTLWLQIIAAEITFVIARSQLVDSSTPNNNNNNVDADQSSHYFNQQTEQRLESLLIELQAKTTFESTRTTTLISISPSHALTATQLARLCASNHFYTAAMTAVQHSLSVSQHAVMGITLPSSSSSHKQKEEQCLTDHLDNFVNAFYTAIDVCCTTREAQLQFVDRMAPVTVKLSSGIYDYFSCAAAAVPSSTTDSTDEDAAAVVVASCPTAFSPLCCAGIKRILTTLRAIICELFNSAVFDVNRDDVERATKFMELGVRPIGAAWKTVNKIQSKISNASSTSDKTESSSSGFVEVLFAQFHAATQQ